MSGINSLSGLNQVNVDYRPTVGFDKQKKVDANQPQQAQNVAPGNGQPAKATSVVRQLDVLLLGAAKKSVASDVVTNVATVGQTLVDKGVLTQQQLANLNTLAEDAANKMKVLDKFSGRELAEAMKIKTDTTVIGGDENGVIDLDADEDVKEDVKEEVKKDVKEEVDVGEQNLNVVDDSVLDLDDDYDNTEVPNQGADNAKVPDKVADNVKVLDKGIEKGGQPLKDADKGDQFFDTEEKTEVLFVGAAGEAVQAAIDAQLKLSAELEKFNGKLAKSSKVDAALQDQFTELQFQCDRRATEIDSVVFRMCDLVKQNDGKKAGEVDPKAKALLDAKFMELMSREAIMMHGTAEAFESINRTMGNRLRPLAQKLDAFAADGSKVLTQAEINGLEWDMAEMRHAIANVRTNGIDIRQNAKFGTMRTEVDKSILDEMDRILSQVAEQIKNAKSISLERAVNAFITEVGDSLSPKNPPGAGDIRETDEFMVNYTAAKNSFLEMLSDFATGKLTADQFEGQIGNCINTFNTGDFRIVETKLRMSGVDAGVAKDVAKTVRKLNIVKAQFKELMRSVARQKEDDSEFGLATSDVRRIMLGETGLSNVVEARVRGFRAGDVDPATEESNIVSSKPLGSGNAGKTYLLTTKAGAEFVFKPDLDGRIGLDGLAYSAGGTYKDSQNTANLNLATQDTAKAFGCEDLIVKYSVGSHDGQFGFFMEKARGYTGHAFMDRKKPQGGNGIAPNELNIEVQDDKERRKIQGELAKKLNRLMWLDLITAQGDRHYENYYVHIDKESHDVTVNAIDNDASFTVRQIGLQKYALDKDSADEFLRELKAECNALYGTAAGGTEYDARVKNDPAIVRGEDGTVTVDLTKAESPEVKMALNKVLGVQGIIIPEEIDEDFYNKLVQMKQGSPERQKFLASLRSRLSQEALAATEMRLDSAIEHAEKLHSQGKVYGDAQWKNPEILSKMSEMKSKESIKQSDGKTLVEVDGRKGQFVGNYFQNTCPSYYKRDCYDKMF